MTDAAHENTGAIENTGIVENSGIVENIGVIENTRTGNTETVENTGTVENSGTVGNAQAIGDLAADAADATRAIAEATKGVDPERADLLSMLARARHFLRYTTRGLADDQARQRTTASELCLGGLIKHVTAVEGNWANFIVHGAGSGPKAFDDMTQEDFDLYAQGFALLPGETLQGVLDDYAKTAEETDALVRTLPDLNLDHALPEAPWFPPGERWTARRVLLHIIAETAQHAGHADIIRESLDGAKTMG